MVYLIRAAPCLVNSANCRSQSREVSPFEILTIFFVPGVTHELYAQNRGELGEMLTSRHS